MSEYNTPYRQETSEKKIHIASENAPFRWFFFIFFVIFLLFGGGMMAFSGLALNKALNTRSDVNSFSTVLSNSHLVSGNCWACDAKTGVLTITSDFIDSDLVNTDPLTKQFPDGGIHLVQAYIPGNAGQDVMIDNMDITSLVAGATKSASIVLGNATKYADSSLTGLSPNSVSTMAVGVYNGDSTTVNQRCGDFTTARTYLKYEFNSLTNFSDFYLCLCSTAEYCKTYPASSFTLM